MNIFSGFEIFSVSTNSVSTRDRDRDRGHYKRDSRDLEGWSRQDNFDRTRGQSKEQELWDPRGKVGSRLNIF